MYFQNAIAQSGGWKLFSEAFQGVYGTYLPFYPLGDDYTPDEINQEDIAFVLWTLKSQFSIFDKEYTLFSPYDKDLLALSQSAYELMDARFEEAPISEGESSFLWVMGLDLLDMPITPLPEVTPETKLSKMPPAVWNTARGNRCYTSPITRSFALSLSMSWDGKTNGPHYCPTWNTKKSS